MLLFTLFYGTSINIEQESKYYCCINLIVKYFSEIKSSKLMCINICIKRRRSIISITIFSVKLINDIKL